MTVPSGARVGVKPPVRYADYPVIERRKQPRRTAFRTQPPLSITLGAETFSAKVLDLNSEGSGLETRRPLDVGCRIRVKGEVAQGATVHTVEADGVVRWVVAGPKDTFICGVLIDKVRPPALWLRRAGLL
jgi:hypothetical protein